MIDSDDAHRTFVARARSAQDLGLDTEFMRVRTYYPELCLVQLAAGDGRLACVDALAVNPGALAESLSGFDGTVVIHAAGQDLEVLQHALDYRPGALFDTQIAAAFLGHGDQVSYASLVSTVVGAEIEKGATRTDWTRRPLSAAQVEYAFQDVVYLIEIKNFLHRALERDGKLSWVYHACAELLTSQRQPDDDAVVARFKGGAGLPAASQPLLRELVTWRERVARDTNRPREWIVTSADLVAIARRRPDSAGALKSCSELNAAQLRKYTSDLLGIVADGRNLDPQVLWQERAELSAEQRARVKALQAQVRAFCAQASISPAAVASRTDIEALVTGRAGRLDGGWRRELLGEAISGFV